ncbi:Gfo/Idh/MocA family protein [Roseibium sp. RKSG952]|uniref:Gfo/Idh/MocA family protein n=1 Tax=Roseibium sp. RKSG952 TaxID=2529384 RepID=UPI0012BBF05F|nr:Gfo/Idh/MocA family oxidoreductase [Roseibium sp. RKSG952]MTI00375.1 Gfo/Idh/MocA family oxidoreductase [Roseibium sp. RKSG952]
MSDTLGVGIIGCGNISTTYFDLVPLFKGLEIRACADLNAQAAAEQAAHYGVRSETVETLLSADDVDVVVNLTVPEAHFPVSEQALKAGKHVYSEKPFALTLDQARGLKSLAAAQSRLVCSAPDTFLGGAHQVARQAIDEGRLGRIVAGTCHVMSHGMEAWHPNPDFFFLPGGGPVLDLGPYYIANLINLAGPVRRVGALASKGAETRTIGNGARFGEEIPVRTPTNIHALLEFEAGATITLSASWDVWAHRHHPMELYGTDGSLYAADPNFFGGAVMITERDGPAKLQNVAAHPFGAPNQDYGFGPVANYRAAGLADMAQAVLTSRKPRCSLELAMHTVDVMLAILQSGESGRFVDLQTTCERPAPLSAGAALAMLI